MKHRIFARKAFTAAIFLQLGLGYHFHTMTVLAVIWACGGTFKSPESMLTSCRITIRLCAFGANSGIFWAWLVAIASPPAPFAFMAQMVVCFGDLWAHSALAMLRTIFVTIFASLTRLTTFCALTAVVITMAFASFWACRAFWAPEAIVAKADTVVTITLAALAAVLGTIILTTIPPATNWAGLAITCSFMSDGRFRTEH